MKGGYFKWYKRIFWEWRNRSCPVFGQDLEGKYPQMKKIGSDWLILQQEVEVG